MKSDSELMNELAQSTKTLRELSEEESVKLKSLLLSIYKHFAEICDKNNLTYMMSGGTCLGAIRHQGFIPWDDDLDVMMPREDYDKFIYLCKNNVLGDEYEFDCPDKKCDSKQVFLKIYKKNTIVEEVFDDNSPYHKGAFIDVFALDNVPTTRLGQNIKGFFANALQFISIAVRIAEYPSDNYRRFVDQSAALRKRYNRKMLLGRIFSIVPHKYWVYWFDCFVKSSKKSTQVGIPTGRKYYCGEIFNHEVFLPTQKAKFEGLDVNVPANYDAYLKNLYNTYMELPPLEKRERHFISKLKI